MTTQSGGANPDAKGVVVVVLEELVKLMKVYQ